MPEIFAAERIPRLNNDFFDRQSALNYLSLVLSRPIHRFGARPRAARGFSLVEVTLAMGIASFALLVIFSMLPTGLATMQDAGRQIAETEIFNRIGSELTSTALYDAPLPTTDVLSNYVSGANKRFPVFFDAEGNEVPAASPSIVYTVQCTLSLPDPTVWSPVNDSSRLSPAPAVLPHELRYATVLIGFHQDPSSSTAVASAARTRVFLLANKGT